MKRTETPFVFYSRLHLNELTGIQAATLPELLKHLREIGESSIYHHTHRLIQQHEYLSPEPPNDFAYWVSEILGDRKLGERLATIDAVSHPSIRSIREALAEILEKALEAQPRLKTLSAADGSEFVFLKSVSFIFPTPHRAFDLGEFAEGLRQISVSSVFFHVFEARLRLGRPTNDFSLWLATALGEEGLARKVAALDPYTLTVERLRIKILRLVEDQLKSEEKSDGPSR